MSTEYICVWILSATKEEGGFEWQLEILSLSLISLALSRSPATHSTRRKVALNAADTLVQSTSTETDRQGVEGRGYCCRPGSSRSMRRLQSSTLTTLSRINQKPGLRGRGGGALASATEAAVKPTDGWQPSKEEPTPPTHEWNRVHRNAVDVDDLSEVKPRGCHARTAHDQQRSVKLKLGAKGPRTCIRTPSIDTLYMDSALAATKRRRDFDPAGVRMCRRWPPGASAIAPTLPFTEIELGTGSFPADTGVRKYAELM